MRKLLELPLKWLSIGAVVGMLGLTTLAYSFHATSESEFCMSCHEMRVVAEQGWMKSPHYQNEKGVVAGCADCHIPPGAFNYTLYKIRDGVKDWVVHNFGENDPYKMDWDHLRQIAREHHKDSTCLRCHKNLTPEGMSIKGLLAHRQYLRGDTQKNCIKCHDQEIHPKFKEYLFGKSVADAKGDTP